MHYKWGCMGVLLCLCVTTATNPVEALAGDASLQAVAVGSTSPQPDHGKILYLMHCRACHGARAWGDGPRAIPALAGQRERYLIAQLTKFAEEKRAGQSMHETMRRPDLDWAEAVRDLAAYLSSAPRSPGPEYVGGSDASAGKRLYQAACTGCHGASGEGTKDGVPAIGGQQQRYLAVQLSNFASGHRDVAGQQTLISMEALSRRDIQNVSSYAAHLSYLTAGDSK